MTAFFAQAHTTNIYSDERQNIIKHTCFKYFTMEAIIGVAVNQTVDLIV